MVLIKTTILDEKQIKVMADKLDSYNEALEFANYLVNKTKFNILKIEIENIEE